jgi:hypothetical protein
MSESCAGGSDEVAIHRNAAALRAANWLSLAAAPTFAILALLTGVLNSHAPDMLCLTVHSASPLGGMATMYLAMSVFHLTPWLKLVSGLQNRCSQTTPRRP